PRAFCDGDLDFDSAIRATSRENGTFTTSCGRRRGFEGILGNGRTRSPGTGTWSPCPCPQVGVGYSPGRPALSGRGGEDGAQRMSGGSWFSPAGKRGSRMVAAHADPRLVLCSSALRGQ